MKKILLLIGILLFSNNAYTEQYPNSWKMEIECKDRGNKWWEASFVVEVVDNKFSLSFDERWNWMKDIVFEGTIEKIKLQLNKHLNILSIQEKVEVFIKGKLKIIMQN